MNSTMKVPQRNMLHWTIASLLCMLVTIVGIGVSSAQSPAQVAMMTLFDEDHRIENFRAMDTIFPNVTVHAPEQSTTFSYAATPLELADILYTYDGKTSNLETFLGETVTTGLLVLHEGNIHFEEYYLGNSENARHTSWSVAKSFLSALVGIAIEEGHITSVDDPLTAYVPHLEGSGYDGVSIKHALQMASGIRFDENYEDDESDINMLFARVFAFETPITHLMAELEPQRPPGEYNQYASSDSQVLGMVLEAATGKSAPAYLEETLWEPLGMEADAFWSTDLHENTLAFCCLNVTLRDYARFGRLYLNYGQHHGEQLIPSEWVHASVTPDGAYSEPGDHPNSEWELGYGYQWWIPEGNAGEFMAIGVWGQYIYVDPQHDLVIVKNSVDPDFDERDLETLAAFRAIADTFRQP